MLQFETFWRVDLMFLSKAGGLDRCCCCPRDSVELEMGAIESESSVSMGHSLGLFLF